MTYFFCLTLPLYYCVALGKGYNFSVPAHDVQPVKEW